MPLFAASTRYSLVKGERIVRSVLTAWLRDYKTRRVCMFYETSLPQTLLHVSDVGQPCHIEIAPPNDAT